MRTIKSEIIGELKQMGRVAGSWGSEPIEIPFFDNEKMKIVYMDFLPEEDPEFIEEADQALKSFLEKSKKDRLSISHLVHKNCMNFLNSIVMDKDMQHFLDIKDQNVIWDYVRARKEIIFWRRRDRDQNIYVEINCKCDWEREHGLNLVFRQGKQLTQVDEIDGCV